VVRRTRGGVVADEITGGTIVWDNLAETFKVDGAASSTTNPQGRVRAVLAPRSDAASAPVTAPAAAGGLQPSRALGDKR
jgi:lipopolysaccharide export system protein LptA